MIINDLNNLHTCDEATFHKLSKTFWADYAAGKYDDVAAELFTQAIQTRRQRRFNQPPLPLYPPKPKKPVQSLERILRRRRVANSGAIPANLAVHFTIGQLAAISIVIAAIRKTGHCQYYVAQIAAMAGVGIRTTQKALEIAHRLGMLMVKRRKRPNRANLTNLITIASTELAKWVGRFSSMVQKVADLQIPIKNNNIKSSILENHTGSQSENAISDYLRTLPVVASGTILNLSPSG